MTFLDHLYEDILHLVITIVVVEGLIRWHEHRRWNRVRDLFLLCADRSCFEVKQILDKWLKGLVSKDELEPSDLSEVAEHLPTRDDKRWDHLLKDLQPPVEQLRHLVERYPTLVDPELVRPVLRLTLVVDQLQHKEYQKCVDARDVIKAANSLLRAQRDLSEMYSVIADERLKLNPQGFPDRELR